MAKGIIKEINTPLEFDKASLQWKTAQNTPFWNSISPIGIPKFCEDSVESFLRQGIVKLASHGEILPLLKIWSYSENGKSLAGCCFSGRVDPMTNSKLFEEILWQFNGKIAGSIKEKKIMVQLLKAAENYAKINSFDSFIVSRSPNMHSTNKENNFKIDNFYTRNGFAAESIRYSKKLKNNS